MMRSCVAIFVPNCGNCRYQVSQVRSLVHSIYMDIGAGSQITFFSITGQQWQNLGKKWRKARRFMRADSEDDRKPETPLSSIPEAPLST